MNIPVDVFRTRGRATRPINATVVRALEPADLEALGIEKGSRPPALRRLSDRHHALARNLALGMDHRQAAGIAEYSESRISILLADPAFCELVEFYRHNEGEFVRDLRNKMAGLALDAAEELALRLEDEPDKFSIGQLQEVVKLGADRTGHGPTQQSVNVNLNVDLAGRLEAARRRVADRKVIDQ